MTIVVGVDGSESAARAVRWAADEARRRGTGVQLVHAWTCAVGGHTAVAANLALLADASRSLLDRCVAEARAAAPDVDVDGLLVERAAASALIDLAVDADLLVVGTHGRSSLGALLLGSVADACVRHAPVPVAVVREGGREDGPVVVGVDGSDHAGRALDWAAGEALLRRTPLRVVHAWQLPAVLEGAWMADQRYIDEVEGAAELVLQEAVDRARQAGVVDVEGQRGLGPAVPALVDAAADASVLVVGTRGTGGFRGLLLGSVGRAAVHTAPCPVVVVPAPDLA